MSLLERFQSTAKKVGVQATAFSREVASLASDGSRQIATGFKLEAECVKAANTLQSFLADPENPESALNAIPKAVLQQAAGLAIFSVIKAGFVWTGKGGSGIVIARLPDGSWSAPSCIATGGVGFGLQLGVDVSDFVIVLNSPDAVKAFASQGNLTIGGNLAAAAGPIGTGGGVNAIMGNSTPLFTYSKNKGLFAGISLEGTILIERKDTNEAFYGQRIPCEDILLGKVPPPEAASALYDVIETAEQMDESSLPQQSYVPSHASARDASPLSPGSNEKSTLKANEIGRRRDKDDDASKMVFDAGDAH